MVRHGLSHAVLPMAGMMHDNLFSHSVESFLPGITIRLDEGVALVLRSMGIFVGVALAGMLGFAWGVAIWLMESEQ